MIFPHQKQIKRFFYRSILAMLVGGVFLWTMPPSNSHAAVKPFSRGEVIIYDIVKFRIKIGEAKLVFDGVTNLKGRDLLLVTVTAHSLRFFDQEKIYLDPTTFFPVEIQRNLDIFGKKEKITEFYDLTKGKVRIVKTVKGKTTEQIIEAGAQFDNIYGFIYRYRKFGSFSKDEEIHMHLPTIDVQLSFEKKLVIEAADKKFDTYYMSSKPKKYKIWFDSSSKRIPIKIKGALGVGNISMVFKAHHNNG